MAAERQPRSRFSKKSSQSRSNLDSKLHNNKSYDELCWCPRASVVFNVLLSARISAAFLSNISDCDETYNYWEPTHYLLYGSGFQTWEYSPKYAIRSYGYLLLHVLPAQVVKQIFQANKVTVFYYVRFLLGILCAACETYFFKSLVYQFGNNVARLYFVLSAVSTGMFISSAAYLPSSFAMYCCLVAYGGWFNRNYPIAIFGIALGSLVGWPFFVILGVPIAFDIVIRQNKFWTFIQWSLGILLAVLIPLIAIDTHYYGKQVISPLNIVLYNVFSNGGPDLYGVESWTFYFKNGFLNFNCVFIMACFSLPFTLLTMCIVKKNRDLLQLPTWLVLSSIYIWALVFFTRPHKEERFLFPIYPLIILSAGIVLTSFQELYHHLLTPLNKRHYSSSSNWLIGIIMTVFTLISLSRSSALYVGYHAPLDVYPELHELVTPFDETKAPMFREDRKINVCVGREWYRYTSSFFLPPTWKYLFLKSEFSGQLPHQYKAGADGTKVVPQFMNDMNIEEVTVYSSIHDCDLLVDIDLPTEGEYEKNFSRLRNRWEIIYSKKFLDSTRSHPFFRAYYIPFISEKYTTYVDYNLLKSKRDRRKMHFDDE
ncbi:alpha-1,2-mannosyltransferase ALG9-like [Hydractinia symbiolongicarpus]|uniref:alpha-1,2-mannosyltransferase ALG9-like n=1 Tax=Hydractinia symbiolongicarpus TaxID=13093 RepID=UPI00255076B2|nr:alpha-1,2-mannosyltransferase ALG9-like [Hydractinia symbiolongicarpus]